MPPFLIPLISPLLNKVLDFIPDPAAKAKAALEAEQGLRDAEAKAMALIAEQNGKQADINLEEAKSANMFIAGARPFILWVCGGAFAWVYLGQPFLVFAFNAAGHPLTNLPTIDFSGMSPILTGMLGLSSLRTYEKYTGTQNNH